MTQKEVKRLFTYKDGVLYNRVDRRRARKGKVAGSESNVTTRFYIMVKGRNYFRSRLVFLYHKGYFPEMVDHINRDPSDDRIENLRGVDTALNNKNQSRAGLSGEDYITIKKGRKKKFYFTLTFQSVNKSNDVKKTFYTLEEAVAYRDKVLPKDYKMRIYNEKEIKQIMRGEYRG